jgi:hypothetical protein
MTQEENDKNKTVSIRQSHDKPHDGIPRRRIRSKRRKYMINSPTEALVEREGEEEQCEASLHVKIVLNTKDNEHDNSKNGHHPVQNQVFLDALP